MSGNHVESFVQKNHQLYKMATYLFLLIIDFCLADESSGPTNHSIADGFDMPDWWRMVLAD